MNLKIEQENHGSIEVFQEVPKDLTRYVKDNSLPNAFRGKGFTALWQEFKGDGFAAWYNIYRTVVPLILTAVGPDAVLELRISLMNIIRGT